MKDFLPEFGAPAVRQELWEYFKLPVKRELIPTRRLSVVSDLEGSTKKSCEVLDCSRTSSLDLREHINIKGKDTPIERVSNSLFLYSVRKCFSEHYALGLRPEVLLYTILHEVAICVREHPDSYRSLFSTSSEKEALRVDIPATESPWAFGVDSLVSALRSKLPDPALLDSFLPSLSTNDRESQVVLGIGVLDAAASFYSYAMRTMCGIPAIRMWGTTEDYQALLGTVKALHGLFHEHLGDYLQKLEDVLNKIVAQMAGSEEVDNYFWLSIFKEHNRSGSDTCDGWITSFLNYAHHRDGRVSVLKDELKIDQFPQHLSKVPFTWDDNSCTKECHLLGGVMGIENEDGYVTARLGYAVLQEKK